MKREDKRVNEVTQFVGKAAIVGLIYYAASQLGRFFTFIDNPISIIRPQSAVALIALLLIGNSTLPGIFLGSLATSLLAENPIPLSILCAIGDMLAALFSATFILQNNGFRKDLKDYKSVFILILFGVIIGPLISASVCIAGIYVFDISTVNTLPKIWGDYWSRDALGLLIFSPVLLVWLGNQFPNLEFKKVFEGLIIFLATVILELLLYFGDVTAITVFPVSFLIIPLIIWVSIRVENHGSTLINFITAIVFLLGITRFEGILLNGGSLSFLAIVSIISTMMITSLIISASMAILRSTQQSLSFLSTHDNLTGLYNRLFLETEIERLENSRLYPISVIMADVDDLKKINDSLGHAMGDTLLINVAKLFLRIFRQEDIVSRFGGDEFVILLPSSGVEIARKTLKRIRREISSYNKLNEDLPLKLSMGSATAKQGESLKDILKVADKKMYKQKYVKE